MTELKTDYKEDVLETSQQGKRTFNIVSKTGEILFEDVHIEDVSKYTQVGDEYGQEIINEQNNAINEISKGSGLVFDTYQDYLDAKARGEVAVGNVIYIKEGNQSEITALQVGYNNSNVKLALDTHGEKISEIKTDLSECIKIRNYKFTDSTTVVVAQGYTGAHLSIDNYIGYTPVVVRCVSSPSNALVCSWFGYNTSTNQVDCITKNVYGSDVTGYTVDWTVVFIKNSLLE